jgi:RNA polymerase sigma-70 factor (ECF subfamily)
MTLLAGGDGSALRILAQRHVRRALAIAERILGNKSDAEEIVQEAMLRIWTHAHYWKPERARFVTWFQRILVNLCLDRTRRPAMAALDESHHPVDPTPGPDVQAEGRQVGRAIAAAIGALPARQRVALTLCYYQDMSCAEAAKVLAISVSSMEALLVRGRRTLREQLRPWDIEDPEDSA